MSTTSGPPSSHSSQYVLPGTCVTAASRARSPERVAPRTEPRAPAARSHYAAAALADIPRLLGAIDRNPYRPTYGCLDRQYWHYRTACFPSQMFQEGALALALVWAHPMPGNRWHGDARVRELAIAAVRFAATSSHRDGSCDDYYPFERALGAAVFSLQAAAKACQILELDDPRISTWLKHRAHWIMRHDESGRLTNHHALAALGLLRVGIITGKSEFREAAYDRLRRVLQWQHDEGWFEEYGGADPGYQTLTIDCLAKCRQATGDNRLDEPLGRAVRFARLCLHPDGSYGGEYGSRGTYCFYPHGMELLAATDANAADLADAHLRNLASGTHARFDDDRMVVHRPANLIEAWLDWSPVRAVAEDEKAAGPRTQYLPGAHLLIRRTRQRHTVVSAARGGVFKHFAQGARPVTDAGLIVETATGRIAVSQQFDPRRSIELPVDVDAGNGQRVGRLFSVGGPLCWVSAQTATPVRQAAFHVGMWSVGRWCRTLVRRALQHLLITGRKRCPVRLTRSFEFLPGRRPHRRPRLRVTDTIELSGPWIKVRRMAFGTDHQSAYVAASGAYQEAVLRPWTDLSGYVDELNARRRVTVVREF